MPAVAAVQPAREGTSLMIVASSPGTAPRPRNSEILGADLTDYPPALNDLYSERPLGKWLDKVFALADSIPGLPPAWHNSLDLRSIDHSIQFHPGLPDPHPPGDPYHDVYVVSVPHRKWPTSLKHWSLYTQGCFFHLIQKSAPELKMELVDVNTLDAKLAQLRDEIQGGHFHNSAMMDRQAVDGLRPSRTNLPLTAYHVGQTVFNLEQLEKIARYTMSRIDTYSLFEKNCHAFTLSMMRRTVMTKRDGTIFTGTKVQIVNWDMRLKGAGTNAYDQYLGFLISGPRPGFMHQSRLHFLDFPAVLISQFRERDSMGMATLYRKGPYAIGAFCASGERTHFNHALATSAKQIGNAGVRLGGAVKEFAQDVAAGEFRDAFVGRAGSRREAYMEVLDRSRKGDVLSRKSLGFHKFVLQISDEEETELIEQLERRTV